VKNNKAIKTTIHTVVASFGAYFCMYAFRKPFTVATYEGIMFFGLDYKILLIVAQVLGYMISKFFGIKIISELNSSKRGLFLVGLILAAEVSLVLFGLVPSPYNIVFMFLNGFPLGMIWGVVFSYIEGRRNTEVLGVILCSSFIVSSGLVKSIGKFIMEQWHISEYWMPATTGALFIIPLLFFAYLLEKIPQPNKKDQKQRTERVPMTGKQRKKLVIKFAFPLTLMILFFTLLTAFRDFRDNFARELWDELGYQDSTSIYSTAEIPIAISVLLILGSIGFIKSNKKAFLVYHYIILIGAILTGLSTWFFQIGKMSPLSWMMLTGFGLYACYVPFNGIFFDRMIATFKIKGNAGFLIYIFDAFGYLGSIGVLFYKNFWQSSLSWISFFIYGTYCIAGVGIIVMLTSIIHFRKKQKKENTIESITLKYL
jgi:MFS family permease